MLSRVVYITVLGGKSKSLLTWLSNARASVCAHTHTHLLGFLYTWVLCKPCFYCFRCLHLFAGPEKEACLRIHLPEDWWLFGSELRKLTCSRRSLFLFSRFFCCAWTFIWSLILFLLKLDDATPPPPPRCIDHKQVIIFSRFWMLKTSIYTSFLSFTDSFIMIFIVTNLSLWYTIFL